MSELKFTPFPSLFTDNLVLCELNEKDKGDIFTLLSDKEFIQHTQNLHFTQEEICQLIKKNRQELQNESIWWGVSNKGPWKLVGLFGFSEIHKEKGRARLDFVIGKQSQKKGLMTEALKQILLFGFNTIKLHSIYTILDLQNTSAIPILEQMGFREEPHSTENFSINGKYRDSIIFSLIKQNFHY